jgi:hypothetical protein
MTEGYKDKDGLERDIAKLKALSIPWKAAMAPHWKRFKKKPTPHNGTNLCTESGRADPYVNGHIMAVGIGIVAFIITIQFGVIIWLVMR